MKPAVIIALIAGGYALVLMGKSSKDTLKANALRAQIKDVDFDWQRIRILLNVDNPTNGNFVVRSIVGDLLVNGQKVANVQTFENNGWKVPANGQGVIPIIGTYITGNVAQLIASIMAGGRPKDLSFRGTVNINNEMIPFNFHTSYAR